MQHPRYKTAKRLTPLPKPQQKSPKKLPMPQQPKLRWRYPDKTEIRSVYSAELQLWSASLVVFGIDGHIAVALEVFRKGYDSLGHAIAKAFAETEFGKKWIAQDLARQEKK